MTRYRLLRQLLAISRITAAELARQPFFLLATMLAVLGSVLLPMFTVYRMGDIGRFARDGALAFQSVLGLLVCAYGASVALRGELSAGTAAMVLTKPVGRPTFLLAKYLGIMVPLLWFSLACACATIGAATISEHFSMVDDNYASLPFALLFLGAVPTAMLVGAVVNYSRRTPFSATAFRSLPLLLGATLPLALLSGMLDASALDWSAPLASLLVFLMLAVLAAMCLALSARLRAAPAVCGAVAIFSCGLLSDAYLLPLAATSRMAALLHGILPNFQTFWCADMMARGGISPSYIGWAGLYAALWICLSLLLGIWLFDDSELV